MSREGFNMTNISLQFAEIFYNLDTS